MAKHHPRAGRTRRWRPARALLLAGAIVAIVFSGLFLGHAATAAPLTKAVPAAKTVPAAAATTLVPIGAPKSMPRWPAAYGVGGCSK